MEYSSEICSLSPAELKKRIDNNPVFLFRENKSSSDYKTYKNKLIEDVFCYLSKFDYGLISKKQTPYTEFAVEIIEQVNVCLDSYDSEKNQSFCGFFSYCWQKTYNRLIRDEIIDNNYGGTKFSESDKRLLKSFEQTYSTLALRIDERIKKFAGDKKISVEKAEDIYRLYCEKIVRETEEDNEDDEKFGNWLNTVTDPDNPYAHLINGDIESLLGEIFGFIDSKFKSMRVDRNVGSAVLTNMVAMSLLDYDSKLSNFTTFMAEYDFFNRDVFNRVVAEGTQISGKELASMYNVKPESVSRVKANIEKNLFTEEAKKILTEMIRLD